MHRLLFLNLIYFAIAILNEELIFANQRDLYATEC